MKSLKLAALFLFGLSIFTGCSSEEDNAGPSINILFPKENDVFKYGQTFPLNLSFADDSGIAIYKYTIEPESSEGNKFEQVKEYTLNNFLTSYTISHSVSLPPQYSDGVPFDDDTYKITIIAKDYYDQVSTKELRVRIENSIDDN